MNLGDMIEKFLDGTGARVPLIKITTRIFNSSCKKYDIRGECKDEIGECFYASEKEVIKCRKACKAYYTVH
jgi:hypothetical protein